MSRERKRGNVILEILKNGALTTTELLVNIVLTPLQHSYKGFPAYIRNKKFSIRDEFAKIEEDRRERRRFYNLLTSLKRDGLITSDSRLRNGKWQISKKGSAELAGKKQKYPKKDSKEVVVISYDIPEKYRVHRDWIRSTLRMLDFKLLHQSVWIGKTEIPEEFLSDLRYRKIDSFIHIFTIGKEGSLDQVL